MKFAKHIHVLHLLSQVPAPTYRPGYQGALHYGSPVTDAEGMACFDHIFYYIFEHWAKPETAIADNACIDFGARHTASEQTEIMDCGAMLKMDTKELVGRLALLPPYFSESVFPVAVARYLLRDLRLPFTPRGSTTFREFHNRYGTMVLKG